MDDRAVAPVEDTTSDGPSDEPTPPTPGGPEALTEPPPLVVVPVEPSAGGGGSAPPGVEVEDGAGGPAAPAAGAVLVRAAPIGLVVLLVVGVVATFGPWLTVGTSTRTSYEVIRAAERLDVISGSGRTVVRTLWSFLPLIASLAVLAVALGRLRSAAALAGLVGLVEAALALLVMQSPRPADWGAQAGLAAGIALVALATVSWPPRSSR